ncbi:glycosyltransferase [Coleofasciculus sp. F4-SAH-05]|uniref:glycosyltransferase n=1 Tax=Coleofasciculus sp. F4-SAH-05 TaxID=3069525 RepID=UPI0032FCF818
MTNSLLPVPSGSFVVPDITTVLATTEERPLRFSLIIPTYKEAKNIPQIVEQLSRLLDSQLAGEYELIVVDDNSPDETWKVAQELTADYPQLQVMRRIEERGLSTAVIRGWQVARGEVLGVIDADLQHPPELLLQLWSEIQRGADLAAASRHVEGGGVSDWSIIRRFLSRGAQTIGLILLPGVIGRVSDPMSGYFMVRRQCLVGRPLSPLGYKILIEVLGRGKVPWIGEVGYVFQERQAGESKVTWKQYVEYLQHLLRLRLSLGPIGRFIRFGVVGFSGVFVDMAVFYLLREHVELGLTRSAILSAEVAILNNFLWNDVWTFGDISRHQRGWRQRLERFLKFNLVCLAGLILNVLLVNLLFNAFGINEYVSKLIAIAAVTVWNFWINLKLSWRVTDVRR